MHCRLFISNQLMNLRDQNKASAKKKLKRKCLRINRLNFLSLVMRTQTFFQIFNRGGRLRTHLLLQLNEDLNMFVTSVEGTRAFVFHPTQD